MADETNNTGNNEPAQLLGRIAELTRQLRDGLVELGLDKEIAKAAEAIPDARERLSYVAQMTERAAERVLNAVDLAQPVQEQMATTAKSLRARWDEWFANPAARDSGAKALVLDTRTFLAEVPVQSDTVGAQLMEIMMAQDFQDLTGQVIKRLMDVVQELEGKLIQLLADYAAGKTPEQVPEPAKNVPVAAPDAVPMHGPAVKAATDAVQDQGQVDDLLESLGL